MEIFTLYIPVRIYSLRKVLTCITVCLTTMTVLRLASSPYEHAPRRRDNDAITARFRSKRRSLEHVALADRGDSDEEELFWAVDNLMLTPVASSIFPPDGSYYNPSTHALVHYNTVILSQPPQGCLDSEVLLIFVPSHPDFFRERQAVRETWGSVARGNRWPWTETSCHVRLLFVLGVGGESAGNKHARNSYSSRSSMTHQQTKSKYNEIVLDKVGRSVLQHVDNESPISHGENMERPVHLEDDMDLVSEINLFNDILLIDMIDSYKNLTRKMITAFQWAVKSCSKVKYILKVDLDIFVNVPLLTVFLKYYGKANTIYGAIISEALVQREGRWAVSYSSLPILQYPSYASGNAYVLSADVLDKILQLAPLFKYVSIEDAFITGILATVAGVERVNLEGFTFWETARPHSCEFVNNRIYVGNNFTEHDHRKIWAMLHNKGRGTCDLCRWLAWVIEADLVYTTC